MGNPRKFIVLRLRGLLMVFNDHESGHENFFNVRLKAYPSIFPKFSILLFDIQITFIGLFKFREVSFDHKKAVI